MGPTPVLIAALGGFRTVAADLLWMKVEDLSEGGSSELLPQVFESVVDLDPHFILGWTVYGWHMAYNLNAESALTADKRGYLEAGPEGTPAGGRGESSRLRHDFRVRLDAAGPGARTLQGGRRLLAGQQAQGRRCQSDSVPLSVL